MNESSDKESVDAVFEQAPVALCQVSLEGKILRANRKFCALLGQTAQHLQSANLLEIIPPRHKDNARQLLLQMGGKGLDNCSIEAGLCLRNGETVGVRLLLSLARTEAGVPQFLIGAIDGLGQKTETPPSMAPETRPIQSLPPRVLLAEDNKVQQQFIRGLLQRFGLEATVVESGRKAIEQLKPQAPPFDLVLMDLQMPDMNGYEATRAIRGELRQVELPIIGLVSSQALEMEKRGCFEVGMNDYLSRPLQPAQLLAMVQKWVHPQVAAMLKQEESDQEQPDHSMPEALPGINLQAALRRLSGNQVLLLRLLQEFHQDASKVASRIRAALEQADPEAACRTAHSLKGKASNLAIMRVFLVAQALEETIRAGEQRLIPSAVERLEQALRPVLQSIAFLFAAEGRDLALAHLAEACGEAPSLFPLMVQMKHFLRKKNLSARKLFPDLKQQLESRGVATDQLASCLAHLDYAGAASQLAAAARQLGVTLP